jgi:hypothetical protein
LTFFKFSAKIKWRSVHFSQKSMKNIFFKFLVPLASSAEVMTSKGSCTIHHQGQNFFSRIGGLWVSKDAELYVDLKITNLP